MVIQIKQVFFLSENAIKERPSFRNMISKVSENKIVEVLDYLNDYL